MPPSTRLAQQPRNTAAQFLEEHDILTAEVDRLREDNASLRMQNTSLLAEVQMLREELARADKDRTRLQGFASNLVARLDVIQETISTAVKDAATLSIQPTREEVKRQAQEDTKKEAETVREIVTRLPTADGAGVNRLPKNQF